MYDKEEVYDNEIAPLMKQIVDICKREGMPMAATFYLQQEREDAEFENQAMWCTTIINNFDHILPEHKERLSYIAEAMRYGKAGKPVVFTGMIRTEPN